MSPVNSPATLPTARAFRLALPIYFLLLAAAAWPQTPTGQVTGRITDASGAVAPGSEVIVTSVDTGFVRKTVCNDAGYYTVSLLPPGEYRLDVHRAGFRSASRTGIRLSVDQIERLDFQLDVGNVSDTVEVSASAPEVTTGTAALGTVVGTQQVQDLPLNSRDPLRLVYVVPGFAPSTSFVDQFNRASAFRLDGGRANMTELFIDGVSDSPPASNNFLAYAVFPSPDALLEFKVQKNSFAAEYGRSGGSVINMVMKSGTNQIHGVVYEFLRNSDLDAKDFFTNRAGSPLPSFKRNEFGVVVGGPIIRDKAFFFANYEGLRQGTAANFTGTFPTALERAGDFSQASQPVGSQCLATQIYDPTTTRANPAGGFLRDPFPGNVIPAARINPVAVKVLPYFPLPNQRGNACSNTNNFFNASTDKLNANQLDTKEDWAPTQSNRFFVGVSYRKSVEFGPNYYNNIAATNNQVSGFAIPSWGARLDYTRVQGSHGVFNARAGFSTVSQSAPPAVPASFSLTSLGFPSQLQSQIENPVGFPVIGVAGYGSLGQTYEAQAQTFQTESLAVSESIVAGRHSIKFGVDERRYIVTSGLKQYTAGNFSFANNFTQGPNPNVAQANLGDGMASFLLGNGGGYVNIAPSLFTTNFYTGIYAQDDFKVTSRLTLNIGLRWEAETGKHDRFNQLTWFDYAAASPLASQVGIPNLSGGIRFQHVDAGSPYPAVWKDFGPRIGMAYALGTKTSIRAGYGLFYLPYVGQAGVYSAGTAVGAEGYFTQTPWVGSIDGITPTNNLSNPFPTGLLAPTGNKLGLSTNVGQTIPDAIDRNSIRAPNVQQWNFTIQRELPGRVLVEAAYVGNKGTHLVDSGWQMDQLTPAQLALGPSLQQLVPNPFYGAIATGPLSTAQVARGQLLLPYPEYSSVTNLWPTSASSIYHAFQLQVQKRFGSSGDLMLAYANGKLIDDNEGVGTGGLDSAHENIYNRSIERSISPQDISQRLVFSYVYDLPVGKGRKFGGSWPAWLRMPLGDWQVNGILTLSTGIPLPITAPNTSGSYSTVERPNVTGDAQLSGDRSTTAKLSQWFDTSVFKQPAPFTFGNGPRTLPDVRGPGVRQMDFSVFKEFRFTERRWIQLRGEFFNLTNTPNFGLPGLTFGSGAFGVISSQANSPRQIQFGLKIYF